MYNRPMILALLIFGVAQIGFSQNPYPITGVSVQSKRVPLRRNIHDLYETGGPELDLYIRALTEMQQIDDNDPLSYFQIEGIHGRPYVEWNGTGRGVSGGWKGYCPHGEELFASWHRPYVLLFEQVLAGHARRIAKSYPPKYRQLYMQAAEDLRSPFWDWAANSTVPPITVPRKLLISIPNRETLERREISNPFYTYKFSPQVLKGQFGPFDSDDRPEVLRCVAPESYPASANQRLSQRPYKQALYDLFSRATTFHDFTGGNPRSVSLELLHNDIHVDAACGQQFSDLDFAAFDPLFMLHHTNVDRLWAYWQAIHPDQDIFHDSYRGLPRFATQGGTVITSKSPLQPFFGLNGVPHTTESVRSMNGFGYSYPGLEYWFKSAGQMKQDAIVLINRLFGSNSTAMHSRSELEPTTRYFAQITLDRSQVPRPSHLTVYVNGTQAAGLAVMEHPSNGKMVVGLGLNRVETPQNLTPEEAAASVASSLTVKIIKPDGSSIEEAPGLRVVLEAVSVMPPHRETELPQFNATTLWTTGPAPTKLDSDS